MFYRIIHEHYVRTPQSGIKPQMVSEHVFSTTDREEALAKYEEFRDTTSGAFTLEEIDLTPPEGAEMEEWFQQYLKDHDGAYPEGDLYMSNYVNYVRYYNIVSRWESDPFPFAFSDPDTEGSDE